ncbi:phosphate signaling complex protein PhoU [Succinivibrio faecicola]|uniref:Phosphate-specific transport system accessory protein PhoU n=1 Tax=Succinivibrio faecicola TaxID=2820300 RepID=A0ABS7DHN7_9GAMM|nr:phosphate signaling complex protein PhoU [Succinivibrio faecicola]MBW7570802.1 phosphate signaling complex protein PhoU [Succinivibrio faecicola]
MRFVLDELLQKISELLILMASSCEQNLNNAFEAFRTHDKEKALAIYKNDYDLSSKAREIESLCIKTILRQQPVAKDMLIISATLKLVRDVERIGTQAISIAELISSFNFSYRGDEILLIEKMSEEAIEMVKNSVDSFITKNEDQARAVIKHDSVVDKYFNLIKLALIREIRKSEDTDGSLPLDVLMIAKYLERIGDHSCNVAKCTLYMISGELS